MESITPRQPLFRRMRWAGVATVAVALLASPLVAQSAIAAEPDCATVPWMDTSASPEARAQALLDASSQHQKYRWLVEQPAVTPGRTDWQPGRAGENPVIYPVQVACTPTIVYTDGPEAVRAAGVTDFPAQIGLASTWDLDLAYDKGVAQAEESFAKRRNVILAPGIGNGRTPLAGRTPEYFGEDTLLNGLFAASHAEGIEADGKVISDLKHYLANEQELDRQTSSSNIDERTLRQVYSLPYEIAVDNSTPESVMCAFNQVNGVYICESPIMKDLLKDDHGFDGFIMSDFGSVHSTGPSLMNGLDQELNRPIWFTPEKLDAALAAGEITQARIDEAAFLVIRSYIRGGLFDNPLPAEAAVEASTPANKAVALKIGQEGSVLLKNDGSLPLAPTAGQTIALFGPTASSTPTTVGGFPTSAVQVCSLTLRFRPTFPPGNTLPCEDVVSAETAITARAAEAGATVTWNNGQDAAAAAAQAAAADVAVVFGYQRMGEFNDLTDLHLQGNGDALISAVEAANENTIVVLQTGSAVEMPWLGGVQAVLENWYGGEQQGPAIASLLFGDVNPSGKLSMTFPASLSDTPTNTPQQYPGTFADGSTTRPAGSTEIRQVEFSEGLEVGYKWYDEQGIEPLFEFGHGLSYTSFEYSKLKVKANVDKSGAVGSATVSFTVKNTGDVAGTEIPQVYLTLPDAAAEPGKRLVGFDRIDLAPKEKRTIEVVVDSEAANHPLSIWDVDADAWKIVDGDYTVQVGSSSRDLPLSKTIGIDVTAPVATTAPSITGDAVVGKKLSANPGVWDEAKLKFSYQWLRDGQPIPKATKSDYRVTLADQVSSLTVTVTATPKTGPSGTATSAAVFVKSSAVVRAVPNKLVGTTSTAFTLAVRVTPTAEGIVAEGDVTVRVGGKSFVGTLIGGKVTVPLGEFSRGTHPIKVSYAGSDTVLAAQGSSLIVVTR